jgi:hypothetical protein
MHQGWRQQRGVSPIMTPSMGLFPARALGTAVGTLRYRLYPLAADQRWCLGTVQAPSYLKVVMRSVMPEGVAISVS